MAGLQVGQVIGCCTTWGLGLWSQSPGSGEPNLLLVTQALTLHDGVKLDGNH